MATVRNSSSDVAGHRAAAAAPGGGPVVRQGAAVRRIARSRSRSTATSDVAHGPGRPRPADAGLVQPARAMPSRRSRGSDRAGRIVVRAGTAEDEGTRWVVVDVVDDGPGSPRLTSIASSSRSSRRGTTGPATGCTWPPSSSRNSRAGSRCATIPTAGATFTIWLPRIEIPAGPSRHGQLAQAVERRQRPGRCGTIAGSHAVAEGLPSAATADDRLREIAIMPESIARRIRVGGPLAGRRRF